LISKEHEAMFRRLNEFDLHALTPNTLVQRENPEVWQVIDVGQMIETDAPYENCVVGEGSTPEEAIEKAYSAIR